MKILFDYKDNRFELMASFSDIEDFLDYNYYEECCNEGSEEPCDHDYNRCMRITNISFDNFNLNSYIQYRLNHLKGEDAGLVSEVREEVCHLLSSIDWRDYFEAEAEGGYYGDTLRKMASSNFSNLKTVISEKLKDSFSPIITVA